jgi:hypothetical protein
LFDSQNKLVELATLDMLVKNRFNLQREGEKMYVSDVGAVCQNK